MIGVRRRDRYDFAVPKGLDIANWLAEETAVFLAELPDALATKFHMTGPRSRANVRNGYKASFGSYSIDENSQLLSLARSSGATRGGVSEEQG